MEGQGATTMSSSMNKLVAEESGWTKYLEDFSSDGREDSSHSSNGIISSSLLSDAASPNKKESVACATIFSPKTLNVKKKRAKKYSCDDDLEDTASSPVNSPKVSSLKSVDMNHRRTDDSISNFLGKKAGPDEKSSTNFDGNINNDHMNLKKRRALPADAILHGCQLPRLANYSISLLKFP